MVTGRKICFLLSIGVILLWLLVFIPEYLPQPLYSFLYVFHSMLTVLLFPAFVGVWLCPERRSIANKVAAMLACMLVGLQAFAIFATYCAWGCTRDAVVYVVTAVFFVALLGAIFFLARIVLMLFNVQQERSSKSG
jgi:hypothetical protein